MTADALVVDGLSITLDRRSGRRPLLDAVSLRVGRNETVGLVGESGSGKSLTSRAALGLFPEKAVVTGHARVDGEEVIGASPAAVRRLRQSRAAMVFQDPRSSVNPTRRIGDFVTEGLRAGGTSAHDAEQKAVVLLREVGIREPERALRAYPHEFSGGMLQRVMIAAAISTDPALLLADEATTALDVTTQAEVVALLLRLQATHGTGMLVVTHNLDLAAAVCDRIYVMYAGRIVEHAPAADLFATPRHPYTRALLASSPSIVGERRHLSPIAGRPLALADAPAGCAFRDRCPQATDRCAAGIPALVGGRSAAVACIRTDVEVQR